MVTEAYFRENVRNPICSYLLKFDTANIYQSHKMQSGWSGGGRGGGTGGRCQTVKLNRVANLTDIMRGHYRLRHMVARITVDMTQATDKNDREMWDVLIIH